MQPGQAIETINPLRHFGEEQYAAVWQKLFVTLLAGFWGRFLFISFVMLAIFFGVRRRNPRAAAVCALGAAAVAYGAGAMNILHIFKIF